MNSSVSTHDYSIWMPLATGRFLVEVIPSSNHWLGQEAVCADGIDWIRGTDGNLASIRTQDHGILSCAIQRYAVVCAGAQQGRGSAQPSLLGGWRNLGNPFSALGESAAPVSSDHATTYRSRQY
uniref:Uncharacterized protein n=1 Tax=Cryptomonas curvata TaxID=233186 RepID=A0A7S0QK88_9CRYP